MGFERMMGRGYVPEPPRRVEREPTPEEERQRARGLARNLEQVRQRVEQGLRVLPEAKTLPEWQTARHQLDVSLQCLSSFVREAGACEQVDAETRARFREAQTAHDKLQAQARVHETAPAFPPPAVSCEAALMSALPATAGPMGGIRPFFDEAESRVAEVLATVSPRETATVTLRLEDPADPLGERFARFGVERRRKLLAFLRSRQRQLAVKYDQARERLGSGRPAGPAPRAPAPPAPSPPAALGASAAAPEPAKSGATADGQVARAGADAATGEEERDAGFGTRESGLTAVRGDGTESLEPAHDAAEPKPELSPHEPADPGAAMDRATAGAATEVPHRRAMERAFGQDFGGVRAHVGQAAPLSAMNARATARGEEVAFASSSPDQPLVAHELTHVVQNRRARGSAMAGSVAANRVDSGESPAEREADAISLQVAEHGLDARLPVVSASPDAQVHRGPPSAAAVAKEPSGPLGAFAAAAREAGVTLEPAHVILNDRFSPAPHVVATIATTVGPPVTVDSAEAVIDVRWTLLDPGREVVWEEETGWHAGDTQAVPTTFSPERGGVHTVSADLVQGGVRIARLERRLDVEQPASDLAAATMLGQDERAAEFERERASLADATLSRKRRQDLGNERALIEFGAHRAGQNLDRPLEPPADAIEFEGLRMSSDPVFLRSLVEDRFLKNGYSGVWAFIHDVFGQKLQAKLNKVPLEERERVQREGTAIIRGMEAQLELLRTDNEIFLEQYRATAEHGVRHTLDESERRTRAEIDRYGLGRETRDTVIAEETGKASWKRVPSTRTDNVGADNGESRELARAAGELAASQREIDRMRERVDRARKVLASRKVDLEEGLHDQGTTPESVAEQERLVAALDRQSAAAEKAHQAAAAQRAEKFPVLATFRKVENERVTFDIAALGRLGHPQAGAAELGSRLFATLDHIARTREALQGGEISLWKEDRVHQLTMPQMLVVPGTVRERALKDRIAAEKGGDWTDFAILALTMGLVLLAAIPTGGGALAAGVVVVAEVGGAVLDACLLADEIEEWSVENAMAGTDMDKARALAAGEPSLLWLALDIVMTGVGMGAAARTFKEVAHARRLALRASGAAELDQARAAINAQERAGHLSADAATKLEDEILEANHMSRGAEAAASAADDAAAAERAPRDRAAPASKEAEKAEAEKAEAEKAEAEKAEAEKAEAEKVEAEKAEKVGKQALQAAKSAAGNAQTRATRKYTFDAAERAAVEQKVKDAARETAEKAYEDAIANGMTAKEANKAANRAATEAAERVAKTEAERAAREAAERAATTGHAFDPSKLDPRTQSQLGDFAAGNSGQNAKRLAGALDGLSEKEFLDKMKAEGVTPRTVAINGPPPQNMQIWEYPDGTVVRCKPQGDTRRPGPTYSVEVKKDSSLPDAGPESAGFKVDRSGNPVPKNPDDIKNPYPRGSVQHQAFENALMDAGHRSLK